MTDFLQHSDEGLINRMMFLSERNTLNIIVEDTGKEYIYEKIFFRMLKDTNIEVNKVFPMGGKSGVIKAYKLYGNTYENKPTLYLVDGDFDLFLDKEIISDECFLYLNNYNIEDYYLDEVAIIDYISCKIKKLNSETKKLIDYSNWFISSLDTLLDLFLCFIIIQKYLPGEPNVEEKKPLSFCNQETGFFDSLLINNYIDNKKTKITEYDLKYNNVKDIYSTTLEEKPLRIICGKYLITGLSRYLTLKLGKKITYEDFLDNLILNFNVSSLNFVKERILRLCKFSSK